MKAQILTIAALLVILSSCSPTINYLGNNYEPSTHVEIFFNENDIEKEYKTMGVMKNEGDSFENNDLESIKEEMLKKAREVGADAIIFQGFGDKVVGEDIGYGGTDNAGYVRTSTDTEKVVEATLIKYKTVTFK